HVVFRDSIRFLEEELAPALDKLTHDFAASGFAGLQLTSPFLSAAPTLQIYVGQRALGEAVPRLFKQLHVREVSEGPRIEIWPARRASLHGVRPGRNSSVPVVNPYRLYADLLGAGERGRAAAEHLHREVIDRAWR